MRVFFLCLGLTKGSHLRVQWLTFFFFFSKKIKLLQTEVTTVICDIKQLKKIMDLSEQLSTVQRVIYMEDDTVTSEPFVDGKTVACFSQVEKLGKQSPAQPEMPSPSDIAVIMYTSGSTGMPKVNSV